MMKLSNIDDVIKAQQTLLKINQGLSIINKVLNDPMLSEPSDDEEQGFDSIFNVGHSLYIGEYKDNSGAYDVDLSGCYVGYQVYEATKHILEEQKRLVLEFLKSINVEVD